MIKTLIRYVLGLSIILFPFVHKMDVYGQACDPQTPSFNVVLSNNPDTVWISPQVKRKDHCCGATGNLRCVEFIITLADSAEAIL
ncbi:hypothetical protein JYU16_00660 [bacterium AH-315-M05]|nr:hypothetical protein [bacterium AH-315-M05]